jgi:hypothetical protein
MVVCGGDRASVKGVIDLIVLRLLMFLIPSSQDFGLESVA